MAKMMGWAIFVCLLSVNQLLAQDSGKPKPTFPENKGDGLIVSFFKSLDWWIWLLVVLLIVLIVVYIKVRKSQSED